MRIGDFVSNSFGKRGMKAYPFYSHDVHLEFTKNKNLDLWVDLSGFGDSYRYFLIEKIKKGEVDRLLFLTKDNFFYLPICSFGYANLFWSLRFYIEFGPEVQRLFKFLCSQRSANEVGGRFWVLVEEMKCLLLKEEDTRKEEVKELGVAYLHLLSVQDIKELANKITLKEK